MDNKKKSFIAFILAVTSMIILVSSTVAWITTSSSPVVSDLSLYLVSDNNNALQIAPDEDGKPGEYGSFIDLSDTSEGKTVLKPVTFSAGQYAFLIPVYGWDGRIAKTSPVYLTNPLDDTDYSPEISLAADDEVLGGYLFQYTFWVKAETTGCYIHLTSAYTTDDGRDITGSFLVGKPEWNSELVQHESAGKDAEYAVRMGFLIYGTEKDPGSRFVIYEPNADGGDGNLFTESVDGEGLDLAAANSKCKLVQQLTSKVVENDPVLKDTVTYESAEFLDDDLGLMRMTTSEERKVTFFLWLEGQDTDCENIVQGGKLLAHIQFKGVIDDTDQPIIAE